MSLSDLTRDSVFDAVRECDSLGRDEFLRRYGFGPSRDYFLSINGRRYDSKAIVGVAHRFISPGTEALKPSEFSGGEMTVVRVLERLGFTVERTVETPVLPEMVVGRSYTWNELGETFKFKPEYFSVAGGMIPRPDLNAMLLITHPNGAKSFDYEDRGMVRH